MKKNVISIIIFCLFFLYNTPTINAQSGELIGGNILNSAVTGTTLGVSLMILNNDSNLTPLRIGLGAGILAGVGLAIYDVATLPQGQQFFISGVFNDGANSSIIILLDTAYGAALGAAMGAAVILITNNSFIDGVKYGASVGAWAGFGFGLIDSFSLAERNRDFVSALFNGRSSLFEIEGSNTRLNFIEPGLFAHNEVNGQSIEYTVRPTINFLSLRARF
ncbi:MAG: hypothetical protein EA391_02175 [Balneolaceae bacterium]|nr:MAG: hypothetical protein EA391_02175 [Balneolaceae bacterium]